MAGPSAWTVKSPSATLDGLQPRVRWSQISDAPLAGLALAREAGRVLVWDDANNIYVLDLSGKRLLTSRAPVPLHSAVISDGGQIVVAGKAGDIWWLRNGLEPRLHLPGHRGLIGMALNPQGQYLAASLDDSHTRIYDWHGRPITELVTARPLQHMTFLVGRPYLVAASDYGLAGCWELDGEQRWQDRLWSSAAHLCATGEGFAILVSCFGHGLQRYGLDGTNEGAYHLGGGVTRAAIDYDGTVFVAATMEGELLVVNVAGHVVWRQTLPQPAKEVLVDAAGQFLVYGLPSGEFTVLDLVASESGTKPRPTPAAAAPKAAQPVTPEVLRIPAAGEPATASSIPTRQFRTPTWKVAAFDNESQAESAVLSLVDEPPRVVVFSSRRRVEVFDERASWVHTSDTISGVGRYLESEAGMVVAVTDREVALYDAAANSSSRWHERLVQISHVRIDSSAGDIVIIEEGDRLSRFDLRGKRRWVKNLDGLVESVVVGPERSSAVTTGDGRLLIFDASGRNVGQFRTEKPEPLALARLGPRWITLASRSQRVRSHQFDGVVEWEAPIPTEAWRLLRLGNRVAARAAGGRTYCLDAAGRIVLDSCEIPHEALLFLDRAGQAAALSWRAGNLMVTDLEGRVLWRHLSPEPPGPMTAGPVGVVCALQRELAFFAG